jgi:hypothetical protein
MYKSAAEKQPGGGAAPNGNATNGHATDSKSPNDAVDAEIVDEGKK